LADLSESLPLEPLSGSVHDRESRAHALISTDSLRDVRKSRDWMVEQKGFEPLAPTSPFHRKIVREFGDELRED
jgi:hypothetical protein